MFKIIRAGTKHLSEVSRLFNDYRVFYGKKDNLIKCEQFIADRLNRNQSHIFLATLLADPDKAIGFAQVYPRLSSVQAQSYFVLNDLFVSDEYRKQGVGRQLIETVHDFAQQSSIEKVTLETAPDNKPAQQLYERLGYKPMASDYLSFGITLPKLTPAPMPKIDRDNRKLVVITGVTSGLGRVMVDRFDEEGLLIAGCGRSQKAINALQEQFGDKHYFASVDVTDESAVKNWLENVKNSCSEIDLLINNASIINQSAPVVDVPISEFKTVLDINVMGVVNVLHHSKSALSDEAVIVNVSSMWGREGDINVGPYCASKFAIEGLTQSAAKEMSMNESKQTMVTCDPGGGIATPMLDICSPDYVKEAPTPEEWSYKAVPFFLSIDHSQHGKALTCPTVEKAMCLKKKSLR